MELTRLSRIVRDRWLSAAVISLAGFAAAFAFTSLANADVETLFETVITVRFDPDEGETIQDLADEVEAAHALAVFAAEDITSENPSASISFDTSSGRLFFRAEAVTALESEEIARSMVQAYLERDPIAGGDIRDQLQDLVERAGEIESQIGELQSGLDEGDRVLLAQHDLLDRQIAAMNDRIVGLTSADVGATPEERATNAALRAEAEEILRGLLADKAALPPQPSGEMSAGERLELRGLQRQLDYLALDYERLFLRTRGVAGRGGRVEAVTTNDLSQRPSSPTINGVVGLLGGLGIAMFLLGFLTRVRKEVWLADDLPIPLLGEVPRRKATTVPGPPWYDVAPLGHRKDTIQALRTGIEGVLDHAPAGLAIVGDHVDSTACRALAVDLSAAFSSAGRTVLLVDADFSSPTEMSEYQVGGPTFADVLALPPAGGDELETRVSELLSQAVYVRTDLAVMPSGVAPPSPADAIAGRQVRVFLDQVSSEFDLVIVVAGTARVPAAQVLMQRVGTALLALAPGKTTTPGVASLVSDLSQQRVNLIGAVALFGKEKDRKFAPRFSGHRQERPVSGSEFSSSPVDLLNLHPPPDSKTSVSKSGSLWELADDLRGDMAEDRIDVASLTDDRRDELGAQMLEALRGSTREIVYEPVVHYVVARVEDILTADPGQENMFGDVMGAVDRYGFIPLSEVKGHSSIGAWLIEELREELWIDHGQAIASELAQVLTGASVTPAAALNGWISDEFFARHLDRTEREPDVWHLSSEQGALQVLVNGRRLTRERLKYLTADLVGSAIDDLERQLKVANESADWDEVTSIEARLKELHQFGATLGRLQVGSADTARRPHLVWRGDQHGRRSPSRIDDVRPDIAQLQQLGLLATPVLTDEELMSLQSTG